MPLAGYFNWIVRQGAELESRMNAVERIAHYSDMLTEDQENDACAEEEGRGEGREDGGGCDGTGEELNGSGIYSGLVTGRAIEGEGRKAAEVEVEAEAEAETETETGPPSTYAKGAGSAVTACRDRSSTEKARGVDGNKEAPRELDNIRVDPGTNWPTEGEIRVDDLWMKYRPKLPWALKGVSFTIKVRVLHVK